PALAWEPMKGASGYRIEIANEPQFTKLVEAARLDSKQHLFVAKSLAAGTYFARVIAIDADGVSSRPSPTAPVRVVSVQVPVGFFVGVFSLWVHKQLQATEIGHTALHGVYDGLEGAERFSSKTFRWDIPIDEESWRHGHNVRHHGNTNIAGRDADIHFGTVR